MARFSATTVLVVIVCAALYAQRADGAIFNRKKASTRQSNSIIQQFFDTLFGSSSASNNASSSSNSTSSASTSGCTSGCTSGSSSNSTSGSSSVSSSSVVTVVFSADNVLRIISDVDTLRKNTDTLNNAIETLNAQQKQMNEMLNTVVNIVGP